MSRFGDDLTNFVIRTGISIRTALYEIKKEMKLTKVKPLTSYHNVLFGCDPEFFFTNDGEIVGSEKVLPDDIFYPPTSVKDLKFLNKITVDGVQAELNPRPSSCRALLANDIAYCFCELHKLMIEKNKNLGVSFSASVNVTQKEMDSLSEKAKVFGCAPSHNVYEKKESQIKVDPKKYLGRSAGGHIHIGNNYSAYLQLIYKDNELFKDKFFSGLSIAKRTEKALQSPEIIVPMLDMVLGNTCVLLDRDPSNIERRKVYGRVGEYRQKEYGIEYRTLSNFWLQAYPLMSFVFGLARFTVHLVEQTDPGNEDYVTPILSAVKREDIIKAINENNFDLAYKNFKKIEPILLDATGISINAYPFTSANIKYFHYFVHKIATKGLWYWFKEDPLTHWMNLTDGHGRGWETFLVNCVAVDYDKNSVMDLSQKSDRIETTGPTRKNRIVKEVNEVKTNEETFVLAGEPFLNIKKD